MKWCSKQHRKWSDTKTLFLLPVINDIRKKINIFDIPSSTVFFIFKKGHYIFIASKSTLMPEFMFHCLIPTKPNAVASGEFWLLSSYITAILNLSCLWRYNWELSFGVKNRVCGVAKAQDWCQELLTSNSRFTSHFRCSLRKVLAFIFFSPCVKWEYYCNTLTDTFWGVVNVYATHLWFKVCTCHQAIKSIRHRSQFFNDGFVGNKSEPVQISIKSY